MRSGSLWHQAQSHWCGQHAPRVMWRFIYTCSQRHKGYVLHMQEQKKRKHVVLLFKCLDIFFESRKRRYLSMDLQRDFSFLWLRQGRSAVGQHGLCSRLLFYATLSYLHSHIKLLFTCSRCTCPRDILLMQNKLVFSLETESLSRGSSGVAGTGVACTVHLLFARGCVFEYLWAVLLSPDSHGRKPCY